MAYVDGFVIPIPKKGVEAYKKLARRASRLWMDHGALEYRECLGDDIATKGMPSFVKTLGLKRSETAIFAWVVYRSKAHRDRVNKKVMADPRMARMMKEAMPFDSQRMMYGGFKVIVEAMA